MPDSARNLIDTIGRRVLPILLVTLCAGAPGVGAQASRALDDGATQNARGGWDLPAGGACGPEASIANRPECVATRFPAFDAGGCTAAGGVTTIPGMRFCRDDAHASAATCVDAPVSVDFPRGIDRLWNPAEGFCILTLRGYDRIQAVCEVRQGGVWSPWPTGKCLGSWLMPAGSSYDPPLLTGTVNPGPGDQCLRCHRGDTEWNAYRARDAEGVLLTGHKNMARRVDPSGPQAGHPWGGPGFACSDAVSATAAECIDQGGSWDPTLYPSTDAGAPFDWPSGTVDVGGAHDLYWIFGDWMAPLPRAVFATGTLPGSPVRPGASYSCARCHTTGWSSDATLQSAKEPEASFPGITWDGVADALAGQVNLAGGDGNPMTSWDLYGVTCSRCHGSAVAPVGGSCSVPNLMDPASCAAAGGSWATGLPLPSSAGQGASHHADLTNVDGVNGGYCTDLRLRNATRAVCQHFGGLWFAQCSDERWATETLCKGAAGCVNPANGHGLPYPNEASCEQAAAGECSIPYFTAQATCAAGGGSWTPAASSWWTAKAAGTWASSYCNLGSCGNPSYLTQPACVAAGALWTSAWSDPFACQDAGGEWTGTKQRRGQLITRLCMDCHRQESGGAPYDAAHPGTALKVGPAHGTVDFVSHAEGNQFLNSPHAQFTAGFAQIGTAMPGAGYGSDFLFEGEVANTGNGCTGCHDVHQSTVASTGHERPIRFECTACHQKDLDRLRHPTGPGTPVENRNRPNDACVACHMGDGRHLFRIRAEAGYSTFPTAALTAVVDANSAPAEGFAAAVWADVDLACGRCHGGGVAAATSSGTIAAGTNLLTVAAGDGPAFTVGQRVAVEGAGGLDYDDQQVVYRSDFESYVVAVAGDLLTLAGNASATVAGAPVEQNPVRDGAAYLTKAELAGFAVGMHDDRPVVDFGTTLGNPDTLTVHANGSATTCRGSLAECDRFSWDWGDGSPIDSVSGAFASHAYATAGVKTITLTVEDLGVGVGSRTRSVTVYTADLPPLVGGTCVLDADSWVATVTDASTDDHGVVQVTVNWGDNSVIANDTTPPFGPFAHTYAAAGTYTIAHRAIDTIGQQTIDSSCVVTTTTFSIGGTVRRSDGVTPVGGATVTIRRGAVTMRTLVTAANGTFFAAGFRPGSYTVEAKRTGYLFPAPTPLTLGPDRLAIDIRSVTP